MCVCVYIVNSSLIITDRCQKTYLYFVYCKMCDAFPVLYCFCIFIRMDILYFDNVH